MSKVNLFILIPENNPKFSWINSIDILIEENDIRDYLRNLDSYKKSINYEKYDGYYDKNSLIALSNQIKILNLINIKRLWEIKAVFLFFGIIANKKSEKKTSRLNL